jgi:hypothetical protein
MGRLSPFQRYAVAGLLTVMALSLALVGQDTWGSAATYSFFLVSCGDPHQSTRDLRHALRRRDRS